MNKPPAIPPPMVAIKWEDATQKESGTWLSVDHTTEHTYDPAIMCTVGFLLSQTDRGVIVSSTWSPDCIAPRDQIPAGMIHSITYLSPAKKPRLAR